jgi:hypothetical protein
MLLALVLAGHLVGDWIIPTDHQATTKMLPGKRGWAADLSHVTTYTLALGLFCAWGMGGSSSWRFWLLLAVSAVTHAFLDRRWPVRWLMCHTGRSNFADTQWGVIATDQAIHLTILCVLVATLGH